MTNNQTLQTVKDYAIQFDTFLTNKGVSQRTKKIAGAIILTYISLPLVAFISNANRIEPRPLTDREKEINQIIYKGNDMKRENCKLYGECVDLLTPIRR